MFAEDSAPEGTSFARSAERQWTALDSRFLTISVPWPVPRRRLVPRTKTGAPRRVTSPRPGPRESNLVSTTDVIGLPRPAARTALALVVIADVRLRQLVVVELDQGDTNEHCWHYDHHHDGDEATGCTGPQQGRRSASRGMPGCASRTSRPAGKSRTRPRQQFSATAEASRGPRLRERQPGGEHCLYLRRHGDSQSLVRRTEQQRNTPMSWRRARKASGEQRQG